MENSIQGIKADLNDLKRLYDMSKREHSKHILKKEIISIQKRTGLDNFISFSSATQKANKQENIDKLESLEFKTISSSIQN